MRTMYIYNALYLYNISASIAAVLCNALLMCMREFPLCVSRANVFQERVRVLRGRDDFFHCLLIKVIIKKKPSYKRSLLFRFFSVENEIVMGLCQRRSASSSGNLYIRI